MLWKITPKKSDDVIEQLFLNRNIASRKEKELFLNPKLSDFESELKISGVDKSVKRIIKAIETHELITIYGDYDVDGICASAILYKALTSVGAKVLPYIPDREKEGYGLSIRSLEELKKKGTGLVITVDNGITAIDQAKFAKEIDLDLIITDHHVTLSEKPEAYSIIHSVKMCGAGVAWVLTTRLLQDKKLVAELLQFASIATICDLMPLTGIGRAFAVEGLRVLNETKNAGLLALIYEAGLKLGTLGSFEVGYIIGPRLNAMGRMKDAMASLRLLCTEDPASAKKLARLLCETNSSRQTATAAAVEEAKLLIDIEKKIHVLASKKWSAGIIGLVAGRICEEYNRPAIAISVGDEISKGSARSVKGINIVEAIRKHQDILINVGGHPQAAGFSLLSRHIELFRTRLTDGIIFEPQEEKVLEIEAEVPAHKLSKKLYFEIEKFAPFGIGNKKPVFCTSGMQISSFRALSEGKHLKGRADGFDFIAFNMGHMAPLLPQDQIVALAYTIELDTFNGQEKLQLKIKDIKLH